MNAVPLVAAAVAAFVGFVVGTRYICRQDRVGDAARGIDVDDVGLDILSTQDGGSWTSPEATP